ncbi:Zn-dependent oxidoreductase [Rhizoclosmatium globosum]|uniref:Zn-dependent oxidoreductase n=1 Tax=Rhizoclosmatium globosum TaxID=329046 RepID=A0A1Y2C556_9FUNG|nr:Zn-dependent oxidoreductase [Rhizoclosmatium globosum]|eukprot:ORY42014.1 Zn-dependent oxidoreductase [Rhizoclosmatium globosum]
MSHQLKQLNQMKAVIWTEYGPAATSLKLGTVPTPVLKDSNSLLVKIRAAGIAQGDCEMRALNMPFYLRAPIRLLAGLRKPSRLTVLGQQFAGIVESVGTNVSQFKVGDEVYGTTGLQFGAYAEYIVVPEQPANGSFVSQKPANLSFEQASVSALSALEAFTFLKQANLAPGERVLILGGGGNIGSFAVQIAKSHFRASHVVAVDGTNKIDMLRSIGADQAVDFTKEEYICTTTDRFDVILDTPGKSDFSTCSRLLNEHGRYAKGMYQFNELTGSSKIGTKQMIHSPSTYSLVDFKIISRLLETGSVKPILDKTFSIEEIVQAHEYSESGDKVGCIAITVSK